MGYSAGREVCCGDKRRRKRGSWKGPVVVIGCPTGLFPNPDEAPALLLSVKSRGAGGC